MYHKTRWNISYCLRILAKAPKLETVTTKYSYKIPPQKKKLTKTQVSQSSYYHTVQTNKTRNLKTDS